MIPNECLRKILYLSMFEYCGLKYKSPFRKNKVSMAKDFYRLQLVCARWFNLIPEAVNFYNLHIILISGKIINNNLTRLAQIENISICYCDKITIEGILHLKNVKILHLESNKNIDLDECRRILPDIQLDLDNTNLLIWFIKVNGTEIQKYNVEATNYNW